MAANFSGGPLSRLYLCPQAALQTVPNSAGVATLTNYKLAPHVKWQMKRGEPTLIESEYKTGTGSMQAGVAGRLALSTFSGELDIMLSGAAGTAPNIGALLDNLFGVGGTVVAATSVTYNGADHTATAAVPAFLAALYNESGSGTTQQLGYGGFVQGWSLAIGGNGSLRLSVDGQMFYILESDNWANEDTTGKGGLTTSPVTEPSSPVLAGNMIPDFAASITFGGAAIAEFRSMTIKGSTGRDLRIDGVGKYPDISVTQGRRRISVESLTFADSDGAALATVKNARASKVAMDIIATQGSVAGYIATHTLKAAQFGGATFSESGNGLNIQFDTTPLHASSITNTNEYKLALT